MQEPILKGIYVFFQAEEAYPPLFPKKLKIMMMWLLSLLKKFLRDLLFFKGEQKYRYRNNNDHHHTRRIQYVKLQLYSELHQQPRFVTSTWK